MEFNELLSVGMFAVFIVLIFTGFPIAWLLGGVSVLFAAGAIYVGTEMEDWLWETYPDTWLDISWPYVSAIVRNTWDQTMKNQVLVALPMFVLMGLMLDRSGIAENLMHSFARVFGRLRGGFAITVILIGVLLAASTGIVGASVVLLALLGLPVMLNNHYDKALAVGTVTAVGTLGILIPPSIMLVLMADKLSIPVGNLFLGAVFPGLMLGLLYILFILFNGIVRPHSTPAPTQRESLSFLDLLGVVWAILPPAALILAVLGTIFMGIATPTEASGVGALGATLLALINGRLNYETLRDVLRDTTRTTAFIFAIVLGAVAFAHVLRGLEGDVFIRTTLEGMDLGVTLTVVVILTIVFVLGFVLDWIQIVLIILPLGGALIGDPSSPATGLWQELGFASPVDALTWFTVIFAVVLQTSFLTPPVGYALFYVKGVAPEGVTLGTIYAGVIPFIIIQAVAVAIIFFWRDLVLWLPQQAYSLG